MPAPCVRDPQLHPAPQSGLPSTSKATACHSGAPCRRRRRQPVPGGACAAVATPRHSHCWPSGQLPPADTVKPHHVPAQGCTLQPLPCSPKGTGVSSPPSQPSPELLEDTSASLPCPGGVTRSQPCPVSPGVIPGVIQAAPPAGACRAPGRSCGKARALPWCRLHPAAPASAPGAHGAPWTPSLHPGHHPAGTGPRHAQCGSPQCGQPAPLRKA